MNEFVPNYYKNFKCIADKCKHSCCIGWEIDIDSDSYKKYKLVEGDLGLKLKENIILDECPHFKLSKDERCPFLNSNNLCELILNKGEDFLCQICTDHPRFRNYIGNRIEIGLGLCCEEACNVVLNFRKPFELANINTETENLNDFEHSLLLLRNDVLKILQNRCAPINDRVDTLIKKYKLNLGEYDFDEWINIFLSMERLDDNWTQSLTALKNNNERCKLSNDFSVPFEQLIIYFIFRYLIQAQDETEIKAYMCFSIISYKIIKFLCEIKANCNMQDLIEYARLYSSEIEYSECNINKVIDMFYDINI